MKTAISLIFFAMLFSNVQAQFVLDNSQNLEWYIENTLLGGGVLVENASFNNVSDSIVNDQFGSFDAGGVSNFPLSSGIMLSTGTIQNAQGPNNSGSQSGVVMNIITGDPDLESMASGFTMNDIAVLEFDFIPANNSMLFDFSFASEEYPEFVNSSFNDAFGFFVSGPGISGTFSNNSTNVALIPGTTDFVSINNVNHLTNTTFYIDNTVAPMGDSTYCQFDGYTVSIPVSFTVIPDSIYHIKMAVGDASDAIWDSAVFIKANSFKSVSATVSVNDLTDNVFEIKPIPANQFINVNMLDIDTHLSTYSIYAVSGKLMRSEKISDLVSFNIDISDLNSGIYVLSFDTDRGVFSKRIIKE